MTPRCECILVGNGTSLLDSEKGSLIDAFPTVVRFNFFTLTPYEKFTGSRCDIWFTVARLSQDKWRQQLPWEWVFVHSWEPTASKDKTLASYVDSPLAGKTTKIPHQMLREMSDFFGTGFWHWSTGLIAVWQMLKEHPSVTLTGFDWWDRQAHHYNDNALRGSLHKPEMEKKFIDKLREQGKVQFL